MTVYKIININGITVAEKIRKDNSWHQCYVGMLARPTITN